MAREPKPDFERFMCHRRSSRGPSMAIDARPMYGGMRSRYVA